MGVLSGASASPTGALSGSSASPTGAPSGSSASPCGAVLSGASASPYRGVAQRCVRESFCVILLSFTMHALTC